LPDTLQKLLLREPATSIASAQKQPETSTRDLACRPFALHGKIFSTGGKTFFVAPCPGKPLVMLRAAQVKALRNILLLWHARCLRAPTTFGGLNLSEKPTRTERAVRKATGLGLLHGE